MLLGSLPVLQLNELLLQLADFLLGCRQGCLAFLDEHVAFLHRLGQLDLLSVGLVELFLAALVARLQPVDNVVQPVDLLLGGDHDGYNTRRQKQTSQNKKPKGKGGSWTKTQQRKKLTRGGPAGRVELLLQLKKAVQS